MNLDDILLQVNKPGRYIGREWNSSRKDFAASRIKFALAFPDLYEIGMSNLGMRIIYGMLNNIEDVSCERFFAPESDLEKNLRGNNRRIFSLESRRGMDEFDIVGFSLSYELNYSNVLNMLDLAGIPLKSSLRLASHPLLIAGGPCAMNPEPMADFFDLFIIGEAEEALLEVLDVYRGLKEKFKSTAISKEELLVILSGIEGVYAPSLYRAEYEQDGRLKDFTPKLGGVQPVVRKRFIRDLNRAYFPTKWLTPYLQIVHDRLTLEIMRGCPNRCYFCQARSQYFPFRQRDPENVLDLASRAYCNSGYEEVSLAGLSVSDYQRIEELAASLIGRFKDKGVNVSLPSLKYRHLLSSLSGLIATVKKTGLTFAPEAGRESMRLRIGKDFDEEGFFDFLKKAYLSGYRRLKLYFMIGLPAEEEIDLDAIVDFVWRASSLRKEVCLSYAELNISVNNLIPKPHTPLQWEKMQDLDTLALRQGYLKEKLRKKRFIKLNMHNRHMSFLEGVFSRGDRKLGEVIVSAFYKGARFDAWGNRFNFELWHDSFRECGIDPHFYLKQRHKDDLLPWDFLDIGISKETLCGGFK